MPKPSRWVDLEPDPQMIAALRAADGHGRRADILNSNDSSAKVQWSNRFANACARMIASEFRSLKGLRKFSVLPDPEGATEMPTFVSGSGTKSVDVLVGSLASGLQIGISLKGMNFRDQANLNYDKNLTGRTYELADEFRTIHAYQPAAFLVAIYFTPIAATVDKKTYRSNSSFARIVEHLRARTGRLDPTLPSQHSRADMSAVALYAPGDHERFRPKRADDDFEYVDPFPRGVVRYFDVGDDPPRRGRPQLATTYDLRGLVEAIFEAWSTGAKGARISWAEPEAD